MEFGGAAIALSVAMFILLRLRHEATSPHLLWVVMALVVMGLIDSIHGMSHFGPAWSWLRHASTMFGGLLFALVLLPVSGSPPPSAAVRGRRGRFRPGLVGGHLVEAGLVSRSRVAGDYSLVVQGANALGGLGFLAAAVFSSGVLRAGLKRGTCVLHRPYVALRDRQPDVRLFSRLGGRLWVWHGARLALRHRPRRGLPVRQRALRHRHGQELEGFVQARTAEFSPSEERFRLVLKNAPIVMANLDRDLRYTWIFNPKGGLRPEDVIGKEVGQTTDPESTERFRASLRDILAKGGSHQWEAASMTEEGEMIFESHAEPLRDAAGEIVGVTLVSIDITARKKAGRSSRPAPRPSAGTPTSASGNPAGPR